MGSIIKNIEYVLGSNQIKNNFFMINILIIILKDSNKKE